MNFSRANRILVVLIAINVLIPILFVASPIGFGEEADSLDYRLPLIQWALAHRAYPNFPWTAVDDYPALGEILMAIFRSLATWGPRIVGVGGYIFFVLGSWRLGRNLLPRTWALLGTLLISSAHLLVVQDNLIMLDVFASSLTLWSSIYLVEECRSRKYTFGNYLKAGIFSGLAVATRYTQIPPTAVLSVFCALLAWREKRGVLEFAKRVSVFAAPVVLFISPWLIRNALVNQNPFFPLLVPIFGGKYLTLARYEDFMGYFGNYGFGSSIRELILIFYRFAFFGRAFDYSVGPYALAFLPWVLIFIALSWKKKRELATVFLYFAFTVAWFYSAKQGRFLIHALPFWMFSGLLGMVAWTERFGLKRLGVFLCVTFGLMGALGTLKHAYKHKMDFPPAEIMNAQADIPVWLNDHMGSGKVLLLGRTSNLFAIRGDFVFAYPHVYATSVFDYRGYTDPRKYYADLYEEGIRFVYVKDASVIAPLPRVTEEVLKLVFTGKTGGVVYELRKI